MICKHLLCLALFLLAFNTGFAQQQDAPTEPAKPKSHVSFTTGMGLGPDGFQSFTNVSLVDELGMAYDTMSLLRDPAIRARVGVDDGIYTAMHALHQELVDEVMAELPELVLKGEEELGTEKDYFESRFLEMDNALSQMLDANQTQRLAQAHLQQGIDRFGLKPFLASPRVGKLLRLDPDKVNALDVAKTTGLSDDQTEELIASANRLLIAELSQPQQDKLRDLLGKDMPSDFLRRPLFAGKSQKPRTTKAVRISLARLIGSKKVADSIKLNEQQQQRLADIRVQLIDADQFSATLTQVLTEEQVTNFNRIATSKQIRQWGTVRGLANGHLVELLSIEPEQADRLLDKGKQLNEELQQKIKAREMEKIVAALGKMSNDRVALLDLFGK